MRALDRGASKELVYHSARLIEAPPTRLGIDAQTTAEWRAKGFAPVLNERNQDAATNLNASVLYNMLTLKARNPLPTGKLPDGMFDLSLGRPQSCSTLEEFPDYERKHPEGGMPFAMPAIAQAEFATLTAWLSGGAKVRPTSQLPQSYVDAVVEWESVFQRLVVEGAIDEPLHVRAPVSRRPVFRRHRDDGTFSVGSFNDAARATDRHRRDAQTL